MQVMQYRFSRLMSFAVPQCCEPHCLKWRRLPEGNSAADPRYEDDWYCDMNPNKRLARLGHDAPQEKDEVRDDWQ
jgi:CW-type Zinc Finger